jgi:glycosyltransferase involved in cell wall biosynthesis
MGLSRSAGYSQSGARGHSPGSELGDGQYAVVHLVSQESHKELIGPQVIDHMRSQRDTPGKWRPAVVVVGLLEPARIALRGGFRARMRALQRRAGSVRVVSLPYVSRLALTLNAIFLGWRIRGLTRHLPVVFHCRGESSFAWAEAIAPRFQSAAIVADVRGSWPEDLVYARGFNSLEEADPVTKATYAYHTQRVRDTLRRSHGVLTVSQGLLEYAIEHGAPTHSLAYVPCSVERLTYSASNRVKMRQELGIEGKLVLAALIGDSTRYQHLEDGIMPFVSAMRACRADVHLLCITTDPKGAREAAGKVGLPESAITLLTLPQQEISRYLDAADAGLLLKAPSRLNRFVQPVKLSEFLAAGLALVVSYGTGIVSALIEKSGAGVVVDVFGRTDDDLAEEAKRVYERLSRDGAAMRKAALALCEAEFLWSRYAETVRRIYVSALGEQYVDSPVLKSP